MFHSSDSRGRRRHRLGALTLLCCGPWAAGCGGGPGPAAPAGGGGGDAALAAGGTVQLASVASQLLLSGIGPVAGTAAVLRAEPPPQAASWTVQALGDGSVVLQHVPSGNLLEVAGWSRSDGGAVDLWPSNGGTNQRWLLRQVSGSAAVSLVNAFSGKCLDVAGGNLTEQAQVIQWACHGSSNQQWLVGASATAPDCGDGGGWDVAAAAREDHVLALVNAARAAGASCGGVPYPAAAALGGQAALRTAARKHACDMATHAYFSHTGLDGSSPWARIQAEGYTFRAAAENIAAGNEAAADVMAQWMNSVPHCVNIMSAGLQQLGVGTYVLDSAPYTAYWVQDFGTPM